MAILNFKNFSESVHPQDDAPDLTSEEWDEFIQRLRRDYQENFFNSPFETAETYGIFGGDFKDYILSRKRQNSENTSIRQAIKAYEEAEIKLRLKEKTLAEEIIKDLVPDFHQHNKLRKVGKKTGLYD